MGKLDPSQQDRWWKSRIEKEELQYGIKNGSQDATTRKDVTFLNTLGQPQVVALASESHLNGAGALVSPRAAASPRPPSQAAGDLAAAESRSVASGGKPKSVASAAKSAVKGSQAASSSHSAMMRRLEGLEEALAAERMKRLQAEEEMRQLVQLQQQRKAGPGGR